MFGLKKRKAIKALVLTKNGLEKNPKNKLTKRQKIQRQTKLQKLNSDIKNIEFKQDAQRTEYDKINEVHAHASRDLQKIEFATSKEWYTTCAELCYSNNWHDAASSFKKADRIWNDHGFRRDHQDAAATAMVRIERQIRTDEKRMKFLNKDLQILSHNKQILKSELLQLNQ